MSERRIRRHPFGPATLLALVVAVVAVALGQGRSPAAPSKERPPLDLESLRREVAQRPPAPPLEKPEPGELLSPEADLRLTDAQRAAIAKVAEVWETDKAALIRAIEAATPEGPTSRSEAKLSSSLSDYSHLSRQYDASRNAAWQLALQVLTADQRRQATTGGNR